MYLVVRPPDTDPPVLGLLAEHAASRAGVCWRCHTRHGLLRWAAPLLGRRRLRRQRRSVRGDTLRLLRPLATEQLLAINVLNKQQIHRALTGRLMSSPCTALIWK